MKRLTWDSAIQALALIRLGQELGTDGPTAQAVHDVIELLLALPLRFLG
jgi:hypothetical protein